MQYIIQGLQAFHIKKLQTSEISKLIILTARRGRPDLGNVVSRKPVQSVVTVVGVRSWRQFNTSRIWVDCLTNEQQCRKWAFKEVASRYKESLVGSTFHDLVRN